MRGTKEGCVTHLLGPVSSGMVGRCTFQRRWHIVRAASREFILEIFSSREGSRVASSGVVVWCRPLSSFLVLLLDWTLRVSGKVSAITVDTLGGNIDLNRGFCSGAT